MKVFTFILGLKSGKFYKIKGKSNFRHPYCLVVQLCTPRYECGVVYLILGIPEPQS